MVNKYLVMLAAGCVAANAASMNNYDLLGRKGSKMNSPMVYKNVDYSKVKKNEQQKVGSSLENRGLAKTGLNGNAYGAIEGVYDARRTNTNKRFEFRRFDTNAPSYQQCSNDGGRYCTWSQYKNALNAVVVNNLKIKEVAAPQPTSTTDHPHAAYFRFTWAHDDSFNNPNFNPVGWSNIDTAAYSLSFDNPVVSSDYRHVNYIRDNSLYSGASLVSNWYDNTSSEVGVFMGADALPVHLGWEFNGKFAGYIRNGSAYNVYEPVPGYEMRESRTFSLIKKGSTHGANNMSRSVIYVGKGNASSTNPSCGSANICPPQVYIGVRSNNIGTKKWHDYNNEAQLLDDYIYENRTIEFVPSGNYGQHSGEGSPNMFARAFAANAITVGGLDKYSRITSSTSTASNGEHNTIQSNYHGTNKPEIYNYSTFQDTTDLTRLYTQKNNKQYVYQPYYEGTEVAAAYTAGMVSNLLATNPFYRWHPEVVKALLLTSNGTAIRTPYVDHQVSKTAPSFKYLVFNDAKAKNLGYYSQYWNGDFNKLKVAESSNEIFFVVDNREHKGHAFKAAIAWLNKGSDIANNNGVTPQDFDLHVYGKNGSNAPSYHDMGTFITNSQSTGNSYEKVEVAANNSNYDWLAFRIVLYSDNITSSEHGQIVLGFNLATEDITNPSSPY